MSSLTETAYYTRRTITWIIIGIIGYIVLRIFWSIFFALYLAIFPPKPPPPNHAFGVLPKIAFPDSQATPSSQLAFTLQTIDGTLPEASSSAPVFFMPKKTANLLALSNTQAFATRFNFNPEAIQESKNIYRFDDPDTPLRTLRYDLVSDNFIIRYRFEQDTGLFAAKDLPSEQAAIAESDGILRSFDLDQDDITSGSQDISFLRLVGDQLVRTTSLSRADAVRVDYFRADVGGLPVFTPIPDEGHIAFIYSGARDDNRHILQLAYTYWPVDKENFGTYALRSPDVAWQELQSGQGYIAQYPTTGTSVVVRDVRLGLYDTFDPQTYLQPIYIFEGDNGFLGYVHAVSHEWVEP